MLKKLIQQNITHKIDEHLTVILSSLQNEFFNRFEAEYRDMCHDAIVEILTTCELKLEKSPIIDPNELAKTLRIANLSKMTKELLVNWLGHISNDPSGHEANMSSRLIASLTK